MPLTDTRHRLDQITVIIVIYHHAQSKLVFERKYFSAAQAGRLRWKTLLLALLTLVPRLLLPQPRYLARLVGRIAGLCRPYPKAAPQIYLP